MTNWENLLTLADYLDALPDGYGKFDMRRYSTCARPFWAINDCGTAACAIGHGPMALRNRGEEYQPREGESWFEWSERVFTDDIDLWEWCFSHAWAWSDNTPQGAAARIRWAHERGVPDDVSDQMDGVAPLCYRSKVAS